MTYYENIQKWLWDNIMSENSRLTSCEMRFIYNYYLMR